MQNRTLLLLQSIIAACAWVLLVLTSWRWVFSVREAFASHGAAEISTSTLIGAGSIVALSVILMAIAIERFYRFTQAPSGDVDL